RAGGRGDRAALVPGVARSEERRRRLVVSIVVAEKCSKWYGHVLGVSDVSWTLRGGIVGLLGPNGAGKSTLIKMMAGLMLPPPGPLTVYGASPFERVDVRRRIGYAPEHEKTWDELTAL